jgi:hypothetical protein
LFYSHTTYDVGYTVSFGDACCLHLQGDRVVLVDADMIRGREWLGDIDRLPVRASPFLFLTGYTHYNLPI